MVFALPLASFAVGLELYSYQDDFGQLIVVDSLERIPQKYRNKAARNFIPSFKGDSSLRKTDSNHALEDIKIQSNETFTEEEKKIGSIKTGKIEVVEQIEEIEHPDSGLDEASEMITVLSGILENNRQIYSLVLRTRVFSPVVKNLHTQNIGALAKVKNPIYIDWKRKHEQKSQWGAQASLLIERLRTIQYTVSKWFSETPGNLLYGFPAFIEASDRHLRELNNRLESLKKLDEQLIQREKGQRSKRK